MERTNDDSWDLTTGVGSTATMVAAARAAASRGPDAVVVDPFAEGLVRAVGVDFFTELAAGELDFASMGGKDGCAWMPPYFGIRARYFDEFWTSASQAGIHQMVNLASGLDSRVYRLPWTEGTVVYEVDQPEVIKFKMSELERISALPGTELRTVGVDLREDWPSALQAAGFDPAAPTAWIAEGLMIGFLPGEAQDRLLNDITRLSASGSKLAADYIPGSFSVISGYMRQLGERWNEQGYHVDFANLYFIGEHNNARSYLQECGWDTVGATLFDLFANAGVPIPPVDFVNAAQSVLYLAATRR